MAAFAGQVAAAHYHGPPRAPKWTKPAGMTGVTNTIEEATALVGTGDPLKVAQGLLGVFFPGIKGIVRNAYVERIKLWQQAFLENYRGTLEGLNDLMQRLHQDLAHLLPLLDKPPKHDPDIEKTLHEKEHIGDDMLAEMEACLRAMDPGPDRDALLEKYKELQKFIAERNARVDADWTQVVKLQSTIERLAREAADLRKAVNQADTEVLKMSGLSDAGLHYVTPQAAQWIQDMHDFFLWSRKELDQSLGAPTG